MNTVNTAATNETDGQRKHRRTPYRPMPKMIGDRFVNIEEIALRLGCTPRSIYRYAGKPGFPQLVKNGFEPRARVGCLESALQAYLENLPKAQLKTA